MESLYQLRSISSFISMPRSNLIYLRFDNCPLQVDDNQGLLLNSEKEEVVSTRSLPRTAAAAHLRGQYQASIRQKKANQAKMKGAEQTEEERGAGVSGQTNGYHHQPGTNAQILPQPCSDLQSSTLPSTKVCVLCCLVSNAALLLCFHSDAQKM